MKKAGKCRKCAECSGKGVKKKHILFGQPHCTMGQAMEIDILEVFKRKNYYMLIFY